jgi:hypothetical protein
MSEPEITEDFIRALPKTDLHVHLDGSIRIPTLIDLAREYNVELPSYTEEGLRELVFKERYANLGEYLQGFGYTVSVMQTELSLERTAYELAIDNQEEGVRYLEVRFAPQLHSHAHMHAVMVLKAVSKMGWSRPSSTASSYVPCGCFGEILANTSRTSSTLIAIRHPKKSMPWPPLSWRGLR